MRENGDQNNSKYWHFLRTYYHQSAQCCRWDKLSKCQPVLRSEIFCDISTKLIKTSHLIFPFCLVFFLNFVLCFTLALYVPIWLFKSFRKIWLFSNNYIFHLATVSLHKNGKVMRICINQHWRLNLWKRQATLRRAWKQALLVKNECPTFPWIKCEESPLQFVFHPHVRFNQTRAKGTYF